MLLTIALVLVASFSSSNCRIHFCRYQTELLDYKTHDVAFCSYQVVLIMEIMDSGECHH